MKTTLKRNFCKAIIAMTAGIMLSIAPTNCIQVNAAATHEEILLNEVNKARTAAGLCALTIDNELQSAAKVRAKEAAQKFSHVRPDGTDYSTVSGAVMAENLATGNNENFDQVIAAWMQSESHRTNILWKDSTKTGIAVYSLPDGSLYIAEEFN